MAELTETIAEKTPFLKNPKPIKFIAGKTAKRARPNFKNPTAEKKPLVFLTVGVTRKWAGLDTVWEREQLEAKKTA